MSLGRSNANGKRQSIAVIGLGNFGATVARDLISLGHFVIGLDNDEARVSDMARVLSRAMIVDAREDEALKEAGVADCHTAVVAIGENLESSVIAAINLRTLGVTRIWAKAQSKAHHRILSNLKVERIIRPEVEMGQHVAQMLHNPLLKDYVSLGNGFHIATIKVPERLDGRDLKDAGHLAHNLRCRALMRGSDYLGCDAAPPVLSKGDLMVLLGRKSDLAAFSTKIL